MTAATRPRPGWELYRSMLAVVRHGTLSGAARELALTQPTVGRHIDALEAALDVALFVRSSTGLRPTDTALDLVPHAEAMAMAAEVLLRTASGEAEEPSGSVRVTASELIGTEVVAPTFAPFREAHPRIAVELMISNRTDDLLRREADIAVRLFRPTQSTLVARRIGAFGMGLYASPSYVKSHGKPRQLAHLGKHALVGFDNEPLRQRGERYGLPTEREAYSFRCDTYLAQFAAIRGGFGIGTCLHEPARRAGLVRILASQVSIDFDGWLVMHEDLRTSRRVRLLYDFLGESLTRYTAADGER